MSTITTCSTNAETKDTMAISETACEKAVGGKLTETLKESIISLTK